MATVLGLVSHELKTPLAALLLQLDRLSSAPDADLGPKQRELVRRCLRSTERLSGLSDSLFEYSGVKSGAREVLTETFDLSQMTEMIVSEVRFSAEQRALTIALDSCEPVPIAGDAALVRIALINLLAHAIKHARAGDILISFRSTKSHRCIILRFRGQYPTDDYLESPLDLVQTDTLIDTRSRVDLGLLFGCELVEALSGRMRIWRHADGETVIQADLPSARSV